MFYNLSSHILFQISTNLKSERAYLTGRKNVIFTCEIRFKDFSTTFWNGRKNIKNFIFPDFGNLWKIIFCNVIGKTLEKLFDLFLSVTYALSYSSAMFRDYRLLILSLQNDAISMKEITETLAHGYSSESTERDLSNE